MLYRNKKTGSTIDVHGQIKGENWEPVKGKPAKEKPVKEKPVKEEKVSDQEDSEAKDGK